MIRNEKLMSVFARLLAIIVVIAAASYALTGIRTILPSENNRRSVTNFTPRNQTEPAAPLHLLSSISADGFWALPSGYWTVSERDIPASDLETFWSELAQAADEVEDLDPAGHFDSLIPVLQQAAKQPVGKGDVQLYRLSLRIGQLGVATRTHAGQPRVVGGALLIESSGDRWQAYRLHVNPLAQGDGLSSQPSLADDPRAQLLAVRFDGQRRRVAEFVQVPLDARQSTPPSTTFFSDTNSAAAPSVVARRNTSRGELYEWRVTRPSVTLKLIVKASVFGNPE